jgi:hypothetical protein
MDVTPVDADVMEVGGDDVVSIGEEEEADPGESLDSSIGAEDPTLVEVAGGFVEGEEIPFAAEGEVLETVEEQPILEPLPEEQVIEPTPEEIVDTPPTAEIVAVDLLELEESPRREEEELPLTEIVNENVAVSGAQLPRAGSVIGGLNPSWVDGEHRVVVHTIEGQVKRGVIRNADLLDDAISLDPLSGVPPERIPTARLKAIFFMLSNGSAVAQGAGRKMRITFNDGRQVMGFADDFSTHDPGFFLTPADAGTADRIFIYRASVRSVAEA